MYCSGVFGISRYTILLGACVRFKIYGGFILYFKLKSAFITSLMNKKHFVGKGDLTYVSNNSPLKKSYFTMTLIFNGFGLCVCEWMQE